MIAKRNIALGALGFALLLGAYVAAWKLPLAFPGRYQLINATVSPWDINKDDRKYLYRLDTWTGRTEVLEGVTYGHGDGEWVVF